MATDKTAMIHLYRGELGRMTAYRIRLDTTSNWALGASLAVVTFALGHPAAPHFVLVLPGALTLVFALLEARRMQDLELIRSRVRLLEHGFYAAELGRPGTAEWEAKLAESLVTPRSPLSLVQALASRVRRNYGWLFLVLYGAWWLKLLSAVEPMLTAAAIGPVPGWVSMAVATAALTMLLGLGLMARPLLPG